jgi:hypothetical protein
MSASFSIGSNILIMIPVGRDGQVPIANYTGEEKQMMWSLERV